MKVVIIGSLEQEETIRKVLNFATRTLGADHVVYPWKDDTIPLIDTQENYIKHIASCNFVIAIPKPDETFEESSSYELALAKFYYKPILIWNEGRFTIWQKKSEH